MNSNLVKEFTKLVSFVKQNIDEHKKNKNKKKMTIDGFRLRQITKVLDILKKYDEEITIDNYIELGEIDGIGKGSLDRVKEILENKKLSELEEFDKTYQELTKENNIIDELSKVIGIGPTLAKEYMDQGIKGIDDLKKKIDKGKFEVNEKILLGLKYHGVYQMNIPRKEIDDVYKLLTSFINKINKKYKLNDENKFIFEICGSYRREKPKSNDIDVLITKLDNGNCSDLEDECSEEEENCLKMLVKKLKKNVKKNNDSPFLVDDITDNKIETKYMGFSKYKDNPIRRIDIRFIPFESYHFALLYFTGSGDLNKKMREIAKQKKLKLSEYGLFNEKGKSFKANSERDIFKKLSIEYLPPRLR